MSDRRHIGKEMDIISNKIRRKMDNEISQYGITNVQGKIMGFLYFESRKRDIFQKDIEHDLKIRSSSVTSVLKLMEKNGYIKRISVNYDARLKKIILTEKGDAIRKNVYRTIVSVEEKVQNCLTHEELQFLLAILDKLNRNLSD